MLLSNQVVFGQKSWKNGFFGSLSADMHPQKLDAFGGAYFYVRKAEKVLVRIQDLCYNG